MLFAPQLVLFDLGYVTRRAYERASPASADLLKTMLALPHRTGNDLHTMAVRRSSSSAGSSSRPGTMPRPTSCAGTCATSTPATSSAPRPSS
jgi:hypothetical protein